MKIKSTQYTKQKQQTTNTEVIILKLVTMWPRQARAKPPPYYIIFITPACCHTIMNISVNKAGIFFCDIKNCVCLFINVINNLVNCLRTSNRKLIH